MNNTSSNPTTTGYSNPTTTGYSNPTTTGYSNPTTTGYSNPTTTGSIPYTTQPVMNDITQLLPNLSSETIVSLLNSGVDLMKLYADKNYMTERGMHFDSEMRSPSTNIYQKNFSGTSNVYSPYLYYNKNGNDNELPEEINSVLGATTTTRPMTTMGNTTTTMGNTTTIPMTTMGNTTTTMGNTTTTMATTTTKAPTTTMATTTTKAPTTTMATTTTKAPTTTMATTTTKAPTTTKISLNMNNITEFTINTTLYREYKDGKDYFKISKQFLETIISNIDYNTLQKDWKLIFNTFTELTMPTIKDDPIYFKFTIEPNVGLTNGQPSVDANLKFIKKTI